MFEFLSYFLICAFLGFNLGVLFLIYQEQEKYRSFFTTRPVIAVIGSVMTVGIALYIELYLVMVAAIAIFGLIMRGVPAQ